MPSEPSAEYEGTNSAIVKSLTASLFLTWAIPIMIVKVSFTLTEMERINGCISRS